MKKLRISYTLLSLWHSKRFEDVVNYYIKAPTMVTDQMLEGSGWDQVIQDEVAKTNCLPKEFGGIKLIDPLCQLKLEVDLDDRNELVTVPDCVDSPTWYEFKTGSTSVEQYAHTMQISMYSLVASLLDLPLERINIIHYNQYINEAEWYMVYNNKDLKNKAADYILAESENIRAFLESRGIL